MKDQFNRYSEMWKNVDNDDKVLCSIMQSSHNPADKMKKTRGESSILYLTAKPSYLHVYIIVGPPPPDTLD